MDVESMTNEELISIFNAESGIYTGEVLKEICRRADMMEEYNAAGNDDFLRVVQNACWILQEYS
jgi:uncharacterized protein YqeY